MNGRPALKFCLLLAAGILAGWLAPFPPVALFWAASGLFLATAGMLIFNRTNDTLIAALTALLVIVTGVLTVTVDVRTVPAADPARFISPDTVTVSGTVAEIVGRSARSARFQLDCSSISNGGMTLPLEGRILVMASGRGADGPVIESLVPGRRVLVRGCILGISPARNPGEIDWQAHYRLAGIRAQMNVRSAGQVTAGDDAAEGFINRYVIPVRRNLSARLMSAVAGREARFLNGLILGERNEVPSDLKADFITVGVMHLLAISGQQVVLVALLIAALLTVLRVPETPRFIIVACSLAYYVLLTGSSPSVTRAGIMSIVVLGAGIAQRRPDVLNALGVAAAAILLWDPKQLFDPGFLLSFSAVLAIVLLYPLILQATPGITARFAKVRILDLAWKGVAVSLAAGLGTAPIVAYYFGRVSLVGFLANILIVPLSSVALVLGMLTLGASFLWGWLASVYAEGAAASAWLTFRLVDFFAGFPYASVDFRLSLAFLAAFYGLLALLLISVARKSWKPVIVGALVLCNLGVYGGLLSAARPAPLRVTFLDVGQGDAAFIEFPGGKKMLIDGGPKTFSFDAGERTVVPFLRHMEVEKIDYLVLSHPHGDHLGGVSAVLGAVPVADHHRRGLDGEKFDVRTVHADRRFPRDPARFAVRGGYDRDGPPGEGLRPRARGRTGRRFGPAQRPVGRPDAPVRGDERGVPRRRRRRLGGGDRRAVRRVPRRGHPEGRPPREQDEQLGGFPAERESRVVRHFGGGGEQLRPPVPGRPRTAGGNGERHPPDRPPGRRGVRIRRPFLAAGRPSRLAVRIESRGINPYNDLKYFHTT